MAHFLQQGKNRYDTAEANMPEVPVAISAEGRQWLNDNFHICNRTRLTNEESVDDLLYAVSDAWR